MRKLVLVGSGVPAWDWTEEMRDYFAAEEAAIDAGDLAAATQVNLDFWVKPEHHDEVRPQQLRRARAAVRAPGAGGHRPELRALSTLPMPTLVIVGDDDKDDFKAIAAHLAEGIEDSELVVVPGAGHLVGVDQPEELNALLLEFLAG